MDVGGHGRVLGDGSGGGGVCCGGWHCGGVDGLGMAGSRIGVFVGGNSGCGWILDWSWSWSWIGECSPHGSRREVWCLCSKRKVHFCSAVVHQVRG